MRRMRCCIVLQGHPFPPNPAHAPCRPTGRNVEAPGICGLHSSTGTTKVLKLMLLNQCCMDRKLKEEISKLKTKMDKTLIFLTKILPYEVVIIR